MRFVGVRDFRSQTASIWDELHKEREMVITSNGKPVALLTAVGEADLEQSLKTLRRARAMSAVEGMHKHALKTGLNKLSSEAIDRIVRKTRAGR